MQKKQTPPVDLTIRKLAPTKIHSFEVDIKSHAPLRPRNIRDVDQSRRDTPVQHAAVAGFPPRGEPPSFPSSNSPPPSLCRYIEAPLPKPVLPPRRRGFGRTEGDWRRRPLVICSQRERTVIGSLASFEDQPFDVFWKRRRAFTR